MNDLLNRSSKERFQYFIDHIKEQETVWSLSDNDGLAVSETAEGLSCFSIWPTAHDAQQCAIADWTDYRPEAIPVQAFIGEWLPDLAEAGLMISVFPAQDGDSVELPAADLREEIMKHLG